jgi:hypothetical protein
VFSFRVVRSDGPDDDTRAYVVMPSFNIFEEYARRVEEEMSPSKRKDNLKVSTKRCPSCTTECALSASFCEVCGHEFPSQGGKFKPCGTCGGLNSLGAQACQHCGGSFTSDFTLTLDDALRNGAIVRGMDVDEEDVREGEVIAGNVRTNVKKSGDANLVRLIKQIPEESWGLFKKILSDDQQN